MGNSQSLVFSCVCASGFGKTALVSTWVASRERQVVGLLQNLLNLRDHDQGPRFVLAAKLSLADKL
jgi:hypothetical protein